MEKSDLNKRIKRLYKWFITTGQGSTEGWSQDDWIYWEKERNELKKEFKTLYYADDKVEYMNFQSFKMMVRMNQSLRVITTHMIFINIKI